MKKEEAQKASSCYLSQYIVKAEYYMRLFDREK